MNEFYFKKKLTKGNSLNLNYDFKETFLYEIISSIIKTNTIKSYNNLTFLSRELFVKFPNYANYTL